jgi:hypothetical protein
LQKRQNPVDGFFEEFSGGEYPEKNGFFLEHEGLSTDIMELIEERKGYDVRKRLKGAGTRWKRCGPTG